jgi:peptide/nickel transport system ATP-binding protein
LSVVDAREAARVRDNTRPRTAAPLLQVEDLHTQFATSRGIVRAVEGVSFTVDRGEVVAIVGESGSGKSVTALSIMRLLPRLTGKIPQGRILFDGHSLLDLDDEQMRAIRGRDISMIFQEPMTSLNPILTIGLQIKEPLQIHLGMTDAEAKARAIELYSSSASPIPSGGSISIRISSPAACASV